MRTIGITGGIGAGKSSVSEVICDRRDSLVIDADKLGHELLKKGTDTYERVVFFFGEDILSGDGQIDRKKLGDAVFSEDNKRIVLNGIMHPAIKNRILSAINEAGKSGRYKFCFIEAALLLEAHYEKFCDEVWYIYAPEAVRIDRLKAGRGLSEEKIKKILNGQFSDEKIRERFLKGVIPQTIIPGVKRFDINPLFIEIDNIDTRFDKESFEVKIDALIGRDGEGEL